MGFLMMKHRVISGTDSLSDKGSAASNRLKNLKMFGTFEIYPYLCSEEYNKDTYVYYNIII